MQQGMVGYNPEEMKAVINSLRSNQQSDPMAQAEAAGKAGQSPMGAYAETLGRNDPTSWDWVNALRTVFNKGVRSIPITNPNDPFGITNTRGGIQPGAQEVARDLPNL